MHPLNLQIHLDLSWTQFTSSMAWFSGTFPWSLLCKTTLAPTIFLLNQQVCNMKVLQLDQPLNLRHDEGIAIIIYVWVYYCVQENFGQKKTTFTFTWRVRMGFDVAISKLQHIQHIDDIPWGSELMYNIITCFVIGALALPTFCACFFGGAILKNKIVLITKKKIIFSFVLHLFIYFSSDATCKIRWNCY